MKISASNVLEGTILSIYPCATSATVLIELGDGQTVASTISMESLRSMDLEVGQKAYAIISSSSVALGIDDD